MTPNVRQIAILAQTRFRGDACRALVTGRTRPKSFWIARRHRRTAWPCRQADLVHFAPIKVDRAAVGPHMPGSGLDLHGRKAILESLYEPVNRRDAQAPSLSIKPQCPLQPAGARPLTNGPAPNCSPRGPKLS